MHSTLTDRYKHIQEFILKGTINNTVPFLREGSFKTSNDDHGSFYLSNDTHNSVFSYKTSSDTSYLIDEFIPKRNPGPFPIEYLITTIHFLLTRIKQVIFYPEKDNYIKSLF